MVLKQFIAINLVGVIATIGLILWIQSRTSPQPSQWEPPSTQRQKTISTRNVNKLTYNITESNPPLPCNLLPHPAPMILMSLGRSGTSSMYQVISTLSGNETTQIYEYTGSSTEKSRYFFQNVVRKRDRNGDWLVKYLCNEQKRHPNAGVVAFKWKPFETLFEEKAQQGLSLLGKLKDVQIKVIRSKRNLLDVMISRYVRCFVWRFMDVERIGTNRPLPPPHPKKQTKTQSIPEIQRHFCHQVRSYSIHKQSLSLKFSLNRFPFSAHCQKNDDECITAQLQAGVGILLPTVNLLEELHHLHHMEETTDKLLEKYHVPTLHVSFEKLFKDSDTSEWKRIFEYLDIGPHYRLTRQDIERAGHAATSLPLHNVTLRNYEQVRNVLLGTKFEGWLH